MNRTAEFQGGRIHGCCQQGTLGHMTTCHHCGARGEVMHDAGVGEPVCKNCGRAIINQAEPDPGEKKEPLKIWREPTGA